MNKMMYICLVSLLLPLLIPACATHDNYSPNETSNISAETNDMGSVDNDNTTAGMQPYKEESSDFIEGAWSGRLWGDIFYYTNSVDLVRFQDMNYPQNEGLPIYADPLASENETPFGQVYSQPMLLIDEEETINNNGMPVIIASYRYDDENKLSRIVSFNTATNKMTIIIDDISTVLQLFMYKGTIYFLTDEGENRGEVINKVERDGSGFSTMNNTDAAMITVGCIYDDKIYYTNALELFNLGGLYTCNLDFTGEELLFDGVMSVATIRDGYIYYYAPGENSTEQALWRRELLKTGDPELLIGDALGVGCYDDTIYYSPTMDYPNILYEYHIDTGEIEMVYDVKEYGNIMLMYYTSSDEYIIFLAQTADREQYMICRNLNTKEETVISK